MARRNYRWRYWKRKKQRLDLQGVVFLIVFGFMLMVFPDFFLSNDGLGIMEKWLGMSVFLLVVIGLVMIFIVVWQNNRRWRELKALRMADVDSMNGVEFENYVANLFKDRGYSVELTPKSGDYGADLVVSKENDRYSVQMKRYRSKVGIEAVQQVVGSMAYYKVNKSAVITNSYFTTAAKNLAESNGCVLMDRDLLARWIWEFGNKNQTESSSHS